jgi:hypothetical protein
MSRRYEEIESCPVCGEHRFRRLFGKRYQLFCRCVGCGLERQYPVPFPEEFRACRAASDKVPAAEAAQPADAAAPRARQRQQSCQVPTLCAPDR